MRAVSKDYIKKISSEPFFIGNMLVKNVFIRCARWKLAEPYQCRFPDSPSAWLWNHLCNLATGTFNCCYPADGNLVYSRDTISRFEHKVTTGTTKRLGGKQQVTVILKTLDIGAHRVHIAESSWTDIFPNLFERWFKKIRYSVNETVKILLAWNFIREFSN